MPSSVTDRLTTTHELIYFLTRSPGYFFDLDPIRRPLVSGKRQNSSDAPRSYPPAGIGAANRKGWTLNDNRGLSRLKSSGLSGHPLGKNPGDVWTLPTAGFRGGHFARLPHEPCRTPIACHLPGAGLLRVRSAVAPCA